MLIVQVCDFGEDGDACHRMHEPSRHLGRLPGVTAVDCHFRHRHLPQLIDEADVLVLQFVNDWEWLPVCSRRRAHGKVTIFEANDYFFDLHPWNPIADGWHDPLVQELYRQLLGAADGVQTSTPQLARHWRRHGARQCAVFANHLAEVPPLPPEPARPFTVGWAGSPGHAADWVAIAPALAGWLDRHPDVHLAVMCGDLLRPFVPLTGTSRGRFVPFGSLADYFAFLEKIDVGLAPLLPTEYNRCRSDVKFLEYASRGVVGIYADLEPYRGSVVPGETGLLHRTPAELIAALERLHADAGLRRRLRQQAHEHVLRERRLTARIGERVAWYRSLMPVAPGTTTLPEEIVAAAKRDAGYLAMRPQEPERLLLEASNRPDKDAAALARLCRDFPEYRAAQQQLGRALNDQRRHRDALGVLEGAAAADPGSSLTRCEVARAQHGVGDGRAQATLEATIRETPRFLPAWQYLLRLLVVTKSLDRERWADLAIAEFPNCYPIAILAALAYPPDETIDRLQRLLDGRDFTPGERSPALSTFRAAILSAIGAASFGPRVVDLLRTACEVFPDSARLADEFGSALLRVGRLEEAFAQQARALSLRRIFKTHREEYPYATPEPPGWLFAESMHAGQPAAVAEPRLTTDIDALRDEAYRRYQAGDPSEARALCRRVLDVDPRQPETLYLVGVLAQDDGRLEDAAESIGQAVEESPENAVFVNALGEIRNALGRPDEAMTCFRRALAARPTYDRAHNNLGLLLHAQSDLPAAKLHFDEAIRLNPRYAIAHNNLGAVCQAESKPVEAAEHFRRALSVRPDYPEAHFNLGAALQAMGDPATAVVSFREAIRIRPNYGRAHFQLGQALEQLRHDHDALACYETAARLRPEDAEIHQRLGDLLLIKQDYPAALAALEEAVRLAPDDAGPFARLVNARQQACDWRTYDADVARLWTDAERQIAANKPTSVVPFQALSLPWSLERLAAVARNHSAALSERYPPLGIAAPAKKGRLRVGYVSGDFYDHPIAHLLQALFRRHDREQFEAFAYSFSPPDDSPYRKRIEREVEHFVDVGLLSIDALARRIADDGIHVLVDVMGYTGFHRLGLFARRPAPIQVSFLGMLGTCGAGFLDYLIADPTVTPPEFTPWFTEKFATLPDCYLIAEPEPSPTGAVRRADLGLPEEAFVYCSFNSAYKIEPAMFDVWMRILAQVPGSVLWMYASAPLVETNLKREATARGIAAERLVFAPFVPRPEHLARHRAADLFLDTRLYGAAATASVSLLAGLPMLSCPGPTFGSRVGSSLLRAAGLAELVAGDLAAYERLAIDLAHRPERLRSLRERLSVGQVPLFDADRFVCHLEQAFETMWRFHSSGGPPRAFHVAGSSAE
jgi:predicted O-linked N-acetylglucosamine transferase (SPINDLY family)